jgi:hypothetical protein
LTTTPRSCQSRFEFQQRNPPVPDPLEKPENRYQAVVVVRRVMFTRDHMLGRRVRCPGGLRVVDTEIELKIRQRRDIDRVDDFIP